MREGKETLIIRKNNITIQGITGRAVDIKEVQIKMNKLPKSGGIIYI